MGDWKWKPECIGNIYMYLDTCYVCSDGKGAPFCA